MRLRHWCGLSTRFLRARPGRSLLMVAAIALATSLLAALLTLNVTLQHAVDQKVRDRSGTYDVMVIAPTQSALDEQTDRGVRGIRFVKWAVPLLVHPTNSNETPIQFYTGVGQFPPEQFAFRMVQGREPGPGEVALTTALAERLGVSLGDTITLPFPDGPRTVRVVGTVPQSGQPPTAFFAYDWLKTQLGATGASGLLVGLNNANSKQPFAAAVQQQFPQMTVDLRTGLADQRRALSGWGSIGGTLAGGGMLTSCFLIFGAFQIIVQERIRELSLLRSLGADSRQISVIVLMEALTLGAAGALAGLALGVLGAWGAVIVIGQYLQLPAQGLVLPAAGLAGVAAGGLLLTLGGAWPAARQAGKLAPIAAMRQNSSVEQTGSRPAGRAALVLFSLAVGVSAVSYLPATPVPTQSLLGSLAAVLLLAAVVLILPVVLPWFTRLLTGSLRAWFPVQALLGQRNIERQRRRASQTAGITVLGLALLTAIAALLLSENSTKEALVLQRYPTEAVIAGPWGSQTGYGDDLVQQVRAVPGVKGMIPINLEVPVDLIGFDPTRMSTEYAGMKQSRAEAPGRIWLQPADLAALGSIFQYGKVEGNFTGGLVVTRKFVKNMGLHAGDPLRMKLPGASAEVTLPISAVVDNLPVSEVPMVDRSLLPPALSQQYRQSFVQLAPGADRQQVKNTITQLLTSRYPSFTYEDVTDVLLRLRQEVRQSMMLIYAGAVMLLLIAAVGVINTVTATLHERQHEVAMMRAVGATPRQMWLALLLETACLGLAGSLLGGLTGVLMVLTGWQHAIVAGVGPTFPVGLIVAGILAGPLIAAAATLAPARSGLRKPLTEALHG